MSSPFGSAQPPDAHQLREGLITGLLGAVVVALFFFFVDLSRGQTLMTPSVLGDAFILHRPVALDAPDPAAVVVYSIFHFAAFIAFGLVLAVLARASEVSSLARYAVVQLLVAFVLFFYGVVSVASEVVRGRLPFVGILVANGLAGVVMVTWLWRHHPRLQIAVARTPLGATDGRT